MSEINNTVKDLMLFFGTEDRPVKPGEFKSFWESLTEDQKAWYKSQPLASV